MKQNTVRNLVLSHKDSQFWNDTHSKSLRNFQTVFRNTFRNLTVFFQVSNETFSAKSSMIYKICCYIFGQLAFRSVQQSFKHIRSKTRKLLYLNDASNDPVAMEMEETIDAYLRKSLNRYDLSSNVQVRRLLIRNSESNLNVLAIFT